SECNAIYCLKYDVATQTLVPGGPADSSRYRAPVASPNPAARVATISFSVPGPEHIELSIFDVAGRRVKSINVDVHDPGEQTVTWDGTDESGAAVAAGTYFYNVKTRLGVATTKVILLR